MNLLNKTFWFIVWLLLLFISLYTCRYFYENQEYFKKTNISQEVDESNIIEDIIESERADVRVFENFLQEGEAEHLIETYKSRLSRSGGVIDGGKRSYGEFRTSSSAFLKKAEDPIVKRIEDRIARFTNTTAVQLEPLQLLNYQEGQQFMFHYDWFQESHVESEGGQRLATVILYLNDIPEEYGGGTRFGNLDFTVIPIKNNALYFKNINADGSGNVNTLHAGDKLLTNKTEKWAINSWIRVAEYKRDW